MIEEYKSKKIEGKITFSGSNLNNYFYNPKLFWDRVFDRDSFTGTTSTVLGTIVHYCAHKYLTTRSVEKSEIEEYINKQSNDIDKEFIRNHYLDMGNQLFEYLDKNNIHNMSFHSEKSLQWDISKYGVLTGTCDLISLDTLIDFKTTSKLSENNMLPMNYIRQLQAYFYLCMKNNIPVRNAKVVYITIPRIGEVSQTTGKALRDYPCKIYEVSVDNQMLDMQLVEMWLNHIGSAIDFIVENPQYEKIITREGIM